MLLHFKKTTYRSIHIYFDLYYLIIYLDFSYDGNAEQPAFDSYLV